MNSDCCTEQSLNPLMHRGIDPKKSLARVRPQNESAQNGIDKLIKKS
jgi:hypothetical protein